MKTRADVIRQAVEQLKTSKFKATAIKIEFEANLHRGDGNYCSNCDEGSNECQECSGNASHDCSECDGGGEIAVNNQAEQCPVCDGGGTVDCEECDNGYVTCNSCDGNYENSGGDEFASDSYCLEYILEALATKLGTTFNRQAISYDTYDRHSNAVARNMFPGLVYAHFYNDGSVDSELTFTVSLANPDHLDLLPKMLEAWNELCAEASGNDVDVSGAGMHMALLRDPACSYPSDYGYRTSAGARPNDRRYANFKRSMALCLPALYFLGTANERSRGLNYRRPQVSTDKYSAIHYGNGALEFRVFDTCYDKPDQLLDNLVVMANCVRFWQDEYKPSGLKRVCEQVAFGNDRDNTLDRFYRTAQHLDLLNAGLEKLKPAYYTITEIKQQRCFKTTKRTLKSLVSKREQQARLEYREYEERFNWGLLAREQEEIGHVLKNMPPQADTDKALREAKQQAEAYVAARRLEKRPLNAYIEEAIAKFNDSYKGCYALRED